ncbi:DNA primase [Clostridiaceae bacterium M8S5]|nr:DNA primase [Clostridiaceae bacterium M8S5]
MSYALSDELIEKIKEDNDIVDVISDYIELNKAGVNYKACCPFHQEKTPSFVVSPSKQIYHCFGCGEGGDVISFISKYLNIDFKESAEILADRAGIVINEKDDNNKVANKKKLLFQINKEAAIYFYKNLRNNYKAINYLKNRQIDSDMIKAFGLGYALDDWEDLKRYLVSKGYKEELIYEAGLIIKRNNNNGYYNRFRNRIIFPIINNKNKIIGFGGRVIDKALPKYLNSPDTPVFNKRYNVYGANNLSKHSENNKILLTEGYMDTITLYKYGFKNAVASLGTAFTKEQAEFLKKYKKDIYICYDSDTAGQKAVSLAFEIFNQVGIKAKAVIFNKAKDPDEYLRKFGPSMFNELLANSLNYIDYKIYLYRKLYNIQTPEGKINFTEEVIKLLATVKSSVERDVYIKKISKETGISPEAINRDSYKLMNDGKDKYIKKQYRYNNKDRISPVKNTLQLGYISAESNLINLLITNKNVYDKIFTEFMTDDFLDEVNISLAEKIYEIYQTENYIDLNVLKSKCNDEELNKLNTILDTDIKINYNNKDKAIEDYISIIKMQKLKITKDEVKNKIKLIELKETKTDEDIKELKLLLQQLIDIKEKIVLHDKFH